MENDWYTSGTVRGNQVCLTSQHIDLCGYLTETQAERRQNEQPGALEDEHDIEISVPSPNDHCRNLIPCRN